MQTTEYTSSLSLVGYAKAFLETYRFTAIPKQNETSVLYHESVATIVLDRNGPFQVELVLMRPNSPEWPGEHRHPNVESIEVELYDCAHCSRNGKLVDTPDFTIRGLPCVYLRPTDWHRSPSKPYGSALLSIQLWAAGVTPTSVGLDWEGQPTTIGHRIQQFAAKGHTAPPPQSGPI